MKRGFQFDCKHPGAVSTYCATFADVQRVKLCAPCTTAINNNAEDPRSIADTVSEAIRLRDGKH